MSEWTPSDKLLALSRYLSHIVNKDEYIDEYKIRDAIKSYEQEYKRTVVVSAQTDTQTDTQTDYEKVANKNLAPYFSIRFAAPKKKILKRVHYKIRPTSCNPDDEWELYGKDWRDIKHMIATGKSKRGEEIGYIEKGFIEDEYNPDGSFHTYYPDVSEYEVIYEHPDIEQHVGVED